MAVALNHETHPALRWMWRHAQFAAEDRAAFVGAVQAYEDAPTVARLEAVVGMAPGNPFSRWYEAERARLGCPVPWRAM